MKQRSKTIKITLLFIIVFIQFTNNYIKGQNWSIEYVLEGDSSVFMLSKNKIMQGKLVDFTFPAYNYYQTASKKAVQSIKVGNNEIIELQFNSPKRSCSELNFESDIYTEGIDSILFFIKTIDNHLIPVAQKNILHEYKGYTYLPTINFSVSKTNDSIENIVIVGKSRNENRKLIIGRLTCSKKITFSAENMREVDSLVSRFPRERKSDTFVHLPDFYHRIHGFKLYYKLALKNCHSFSDSLQCIGQFTNSLLEKYELYDVYGICKQELINRNTLLVKRSKDIDSYYDGMKEIIASLNSCHMGLISSKQDDVESPLQPIYFYNINNTITVSAIFDPLLENEVQLGDRLMSINHIPVKQIYHDFSKKVFASTPQQREIKISQKLLNLAKNSFGDSLLLEFQNNTNNYFIELNKLNFSSKKVVPSNFKIISDNLIEKYNNIVYLKPFFHGSILIPYLYSHKADLNHCDGIIIDLRGCSAGDHSLSTLFSYLISKKSLIVRLDSTKFSARSNLIVKPSKQIHVNSPIIFLIDARTTCYPELMINALRKKKKDVFVIGSSNTGGSAQLSLITFLPQNEILTHFEGIAKDINKKMIDDNIGIIPDLIIHINSYKDLFPYNDKIKQTALKYLGYSFQNNDESQM